MHSSAPTEFNKKKIDVQATVDTEWNAREDKPNDYWAGDLENNQARSEQMLADSRNLAKCLLTDRLKRKAQKFQ